MRLLSLHCCLHFVIREMVDRYIVPKDNFIFMKLLSGQYVRLIGMEAAGFGLDSDKHIATLTKGEVGVLHGALSYLLQDDDGQNVEPHSISAG
ncbi:hypothetical protein AHAS_Ahas16G0292100 [Arachis hypogaea]